MWEFFSDGQAKWVMISASWVVVDDGRIKIDLVTGPPTFMGKLEGDILVISSGLKNDTPLKYHKVK